MRHVPLRLGLALLFASPLLAQAGPGLPGTTFPERDLFRIIASFGSGSSYGHHFLHDGWVASLRSNAGVQFYDLSNPYSPRLVSTLTGSANGMDLSEPHTYAQTDAWGGKHVVLARGPGGLGGTGFVISDWSDILVPKLESIYDVPGVPGGYTSGVFWLFVQAPYIYVPVGSLGLAIVDASNPKNPTLVRRIPKSELGGFNTVLAYVIGNTLFLSNSDGGSGYARLDVSDPVVPVLLNSNPTTPIPYAATVNGGKFVVAAVSGPINTSGGQNGSFHVHDIFAAGFPQIGQAALPSRGGTAVVQDQFVHVAASTGYRKFDISNSQSYTLVGATTQPISGGDWDWVSPMGHFVIMGDDQGKGSHVVPHQMLPDARAPVVTMVSPPDGATNQALTSRVGITTSDMIEMASIDNSSFLVRPVGGAALSGRYSNQIGIVNFFPDQALQPNTIYEVVVAAGGMRDWAGNGIQAFACQFTTGDGTGGVTVTVQANPPARVGTLVTVDVASVTGPGPFRFSWDFGDGTPATPFRTASQATHTFNRGGHFSVLCTVTNGLGRATDSFLQTSHYPVTEAQPTHSSTIALIESLAQVVCVNADNDTVTAIDTRNHGKLAEIAVGAHPRTVAIAPDDTAWVVCQDDATIHVVDTQTNAVLAVIALPDGSAPYGIAMSPDGRSAYVSLPATGQVGLLDPGTRTLLSRTYVGPAPKGIAVSADSQRIFVTRFVSSSENLSFSDDSPPRPVGTIYEITAESFTRVRTIPLRFDPGPDTESSGRGVPNYLSSLTISPDGRRLWVPSKKDNIARGMFRSGQSLNFESTVRTIVSQIDLTTNRDLLGLRIDLNDRDMAFATVFSRLGDYAFHAVQGSNAIDVRDAYTTNLVGDIAGTGLAPQGLVLTRDNELFVHNFMSRTVSIYDVSGVVSSTTFGMQLLATTATVANETLSAQVLAGKQIFYNAADPRMNEDGYISCASCHLDGGQDGRVWDFTERGEGLRNTITLHGRAGIGHGKVHWTANFDEIQDFENDIRAAFGGDGFMSDPLFHSGTVSNPLGQPKAGLSPELDALAAYVSSLTAFGRSPHRAYGGTLTGAGQRGKAIFQQLNCAQCHSGPAFTDGKIHDVGTILPSSGQAIGGPLLGFDTPTLRGLWNTAPYLHDGSALTLGGVLTARNPTGQHGATATLTPQERSDLTAYLLQIDDLEPAPN